MKRNITYTLIATILILMALTLGRTGRESTLALTAAPMRPSIIASTPMASTTPAPIAIPVASNVGSRRVTPATPVAASYRLYKDPVTGEFGPAPAGTSAPLTPALRRSLSTSSDGLVEIQSPVPNGGVMVRLDGRFANAMSATVDANGKVTGVCDQSHDTAAPARGKE